jgi:hypothetical protein
VELKQILFTYQDTIRDLAAALRVSAEKIIQNERNIIVLTRQFGKISGAITTIIRTEIDLYIFIREREIKPKIRLLIRTGI